MFNRRDLLKFSGLGVVAGSSAVTSTPEVQKQVEMTFDPDMWFDERVREYVIENNYEKWKKTGLLLGIEREEDRKSIALVLENQEVFNRFGDRNTEITSPELKKISINIARNALANVANEGWIPIMPFRTNCDMVYSTRANARSSNTIYSCSQFYSDALDSLSEYSEIEKTEKIAESLAERIKISVLSYLTGVMHVGYVRSSVKKTSMNHIIPDVFLWKNQLDLQNEIEFHWAIIPKSPQFNSMADLFRDAKFKVIRRDNFKAKEEGAINRIVVEKVGEKVLVDPNPFEPVESSHHVIVGCRYRRNSDNDFGYCPYVLVSQKDNHVKASHSIYTGCLIRKVYKSFEIS